MYLPRMFKVLIQNFTRAVTIFSRSEWYITILWKCTRAAQKMLDVRGLRTADVFSQLQ